MVAIIKVVKEGVLKYKVQLFPKAGVQPVEEGGLMSLPKYNVTYHSTEGKAKTYTETILEGAKEGDKVVISESVERVIFTAVKEG